jgi:GGDEF domain-containing protein
MDDLYDDLDKETSLDVSLSASSRMSVGKNPDAVGNMVKTARRLGVPTSFVRHDNGEQGRQIIQQQDFLSLKKTAPKTAGFVAANPDTAAMFSDDLETTGKFEGVMVSARSGWKDTKDGFNELTTAFRRAGPAFTKSLNGASVLYDKLTKPYNTTDGDGTGIYASTDEEWKNREQTARDNQTPANATLNDPKNQYTDRSSMGHSPLLYAATRFIENAPTQVPMIGGGIVASMGAPYIGIPLVVAGTGLAFGSEGIEAYDDVFKKTGDEHLSLLAAIGNGMVEIADGALDMVGGKLFAGKTLFKKAIQKDLADRLVGSYVKDATSSAVLQGAKQTAKGTAFEGLTEGVQGVAQKFIPNVATGESSTAGEYATTFAENALPGAFGGAILGGPAASRKAYSDKKNAQFIVSSLTDPNATAEDKVKAMSMAYADMKQMATSRDTVPPPSAAARSIMAGMVMGNSSFAKEADNALQAHSNAASLDTLAELSTASRIIPRDAETAIQFFQSLRTEDVADVAIPVQRFVEAMTAQGLDPVAEAERITGKPDSLNDALATGGDFHVPIEQLISKVLPSDAYKVLRDDIRLHPDDMTVREATEWENTDAAKSFQSHVESMQKADPVQKVYDSMMGELLGVHMPRAQAEIQAQLWSDRYRTRAKRLGVDPFELYQKNKEITVTRALDPAIATRSQSDPQFDAKLDAIRNAQIPSQTEIFGKSLIDFVREHGVNDDRGDLAAMEIDKQGAKFKKNILRKDGMSLDKVRELAVEAGYFPRGADNTAFLDAIDNELRGNPTFSNMNIKQDVMDKAQELEQLRQGLEQAGIDLNQMDNAAVRGVLNQSNGEGTLFQSAVSSISEKAGLDNFDLKKYLIEGIKNGTLSQDDLINHIEGILTDKVTGFGTDPARIFAINNSFAKFQKDQTKPIGYVDIDLANLGGLNAFRGSNELANKDFEAIAKIIELEVRAKYPEALFFRYGGDEMSIIAEGAQPDELDEIMSSAKNKVDTYAKQAGIDNLPHPKDKPNDPHAPGVSIYFGTTNYFDKADIEDIIITADKETGAKKKQRGAEYVAGKQGNTSGNLQSDGSREGQVLPGSTPEGNGKQGEIPPVPRTAQDRINDFENLVKEHSSEEQLTLFQAAYHGTPHTFDKFSLSAMGTGEGNQSFGWGLYFAGNKQIAEWYRDRLSGMKSTLIIDGTPFGNSQQSYSEMSPVDRLIADAYNGIGKGYKSQKQIVAELKTRSKGAFKEWKPIFKEAIEKAKSAVVQVETEKGRLYKVELAPKESEYLLWDKSFSEQSPEVQEALLKLRKKTELPLGVDENGKGEGYTGEQIYNQLWTDKIRNDKKAEPAKEKHKQTSELLHKLGIRGIKYLADQGNSESHNYVIFSDNDVEITEYWQNKNKDINRGYFKPSLREIGLLKDADLSTFLHETGHAWLEELRLDARTEGVDPQVTEDWNTIKEWLGIPEDSNEITIEQHEQFARGFEAYLAEGKSPSPALNDAFRRFSAWLKQVYKDLSKLNVKLTPEVRNVMDRLIASEEEIKDAKAQQGIVELFSTAEEAGMTDDEFKLYRKAAEKEHNAAVSHLETKLMNDLKRERTAWWKDEQARVRAEVEDEAKQAPVYQVIQLLTTGKLFDGTEFDNPIKLNKAELIRMYGDKFPSSLPRGFGSVMYAEDGAPIDAVASEFGFSSGDEMVRAIVDAPKMKAWVTAETDYRMKTTHGDLLMDGTISEEAMNAIHNEHRGAILLKELVTIRKKQNDVKPFTDQAKKSVESQAAKEMAYQERWADAERNMAVAIERGAKQAEIDDLKAEMAKMKADHNKGAKALKTPPVTAYRDAAKTIITGKDLQSLSPIFFSRAEKRLGDEAVKLFKKGDFEGAARAKEQQTLNHFLYIESVKAKEEAEKIRKYAIDMMSRNSLSKLGMADQTILEQVQQILEAHGFERTSKLELLERVESLDRFLARMSEEEKIDIPIDSDMFAGEMPNYQRMTIEELRAMYDAVRALEKVAQMINSIRIKGKRIDFETLETQAVQSINELHTTENPIVRTDGDRTWWQQKWDSVKTVAFGVMRPQAIIEALDGDSADQQGIFHDALWEPYNDASAKEHELKAVLIPRVMEILENSNISGSRYRERYKIDAISESMSVNTMIGIVLNMGNESNMDKLMRGGLMQGQDQIELYAAALDEIIGHLTKAEMDMIQGLWDLVETLKPEMIALELRMFGIQPEWVKPQMLQTKHGNYRGGYWPVVFDSDYSAAGQKQENAASVNEALAVMPFSQAFTKKGHLKTRTKAAYPMKLDWQQIASRHLDQVITDIAYREFIITSAKVLRSQKIKNAIKNRMGDGYFSELNAWLKSIVDQQQILSKADSKLTAIRNAARTNATVAYLGLKVANAIVDTIVTPMQAWSRVDALSLTTGIKDALTNYSGTKAQIRELSPYMKHLWMSLDRDLSEGMKRLAGKHGTIDQIKLVSMESRAWAYELGAMMIWRGAFIDAQEKHGLSGKSAVEWADDVVRGTSDAGRKGDLNAWERNPNLKEFTMFIGPLSVAVNQIGKAVRVGNREGYTKSSMPWKTLVGIWVSNAIFYDMLLGKGPDADEEPEKWMRWLSAKFALFPFQSIPFVREVANLYESKATGEPSTGRSVPMVETGKAVWNGSSAVVKYIESGEDLDKALKNANMAVGLTVGLPASQINISGQYISDVLSGEYDPKHTWSPVTDIFFKRKKEK